ncbi:hypothetical protein Catovirus_2_78 [Catovirus CTV1]|uniref:Uncharacterized protein n=1 Tax=Catovirus CTV1 TaxID=1977631 RepID=A0A1V0SBP8_9VIRU|nr:hypothetical protein Catovirus_2_78 [Catovirus CTV1]
MNNICNKLIKTKKINKENTIIILDWDDTLFPTSWITKNGINLMDNSMKNKFTNYFPELDDILSEFLIKLQQYGKVIIITNALPVWVKVSSSILLKTSRILNDIKVVSARKNYKNHSANMMDWKKLAFLNEISNFINMNFLNIISIGDAEYEHFALINLYKTTKINKILKSIKLMDNPNNDVLIDQLKVLLKNAHTLCTNGENLDLKFRLK